MSFNVIAASRKISEQYNRYLKTIFDISDAEYKKLFEEQFETAEPFSKGPYLDVIDSFVKGRSIPEMIESGILSKDFRRLEDIYKKTLYLHQEYAIKKILDGKNVVVSTGTGSGSKARTDSERAAADSRISSPSGPIQTRSSGNPRSHPIAARRPAAAGSCRLTTA